MSIRSVVSDLRARCSPAAARFKYVVSVLGCSVPCTRTSSRTPSARVVAAGRCFPSSHWAIRGVETFSARKNHAFDPYNCYRVYDDPCYSDKESFPMQTISPTGSVFRNVVSFFAAVSAFHFCRRSTALADLHHRSAFEGVASNDRRLHRFRRSPVMLVGLAMGATWPALRPPAVRQSATASAIGNTVSRSSCCCPLYTALYRQRGVSSPSCPHRRRPQGTLAYLFTILLLSVFRSRHNIIAFDLSRPCDSKSPMYFIAGLRRQHRARLPCGHVAPRLPRARRRQPRLASGE